MGFVACPNCKLNKFRITSQDVEEKVVTGVGRAMHVEKKQLKMFSVECDNCHTTLIKLAQAQKQ